MMLALTLAMALEAGAPPSFVADPPKRCDDCAAWNAPAEPFRVFGNTYYVGVAGLTSVLITSDGGHVLVDGALPQSAPLIDANIRKLGFRTEDVKLIVNSHAHFDHAGGIAALQRRSGATVAASASGAAAIAYGMPGEDDPQYGLGPAVMSFPPVKAVRAVADGETLRVGSLAITAHLTPGHTPGSTTWTWRSCEGENCLDVVYADSVTAVSAPGFRYLGRGASPSPADAFRRSLATIAGLRCDVLLAPHPGFLGLEDKLERRRKGATENPFVDPAACRAYAAEGGRGLDRRLKEESAPLTPPR